MSIPFGYMGVSVMRLQTTRQLRELREPVIVLVQNQPTAALVPYEWYVAAQALIEGAVASGRARPVARKRPRVRRAEETK